MLLKMESDNNSSRSDPQHDYPNHGPLKHSKTRQHRFPPSLELRMKHHRPRGGRRLWSAPKSARFLRDTPVDHTCSRASSILRRHRRASTTRSIILPRSSIVCVSDVKGYREESTPSTDSSGESTYRCTSNKLL